MTGIFRGECRINAQIKGIKEIGTPEQCKFKNCPYHPKPKEGFIELFCNCKDKLKRMTEYDLNWLEIKRLKDKGENPEGAKRYFCPECETILIKVNSN